MPPPDNSSTWPFLNMASPQPVHSSTCPFLHLSIPSPVHSSTCPFLHLAIPQSANYYGWHFDSFRPGQFTLAPSFHTVSASGHFMAITRAMKVERSETQLLKCSIFVAFLDPSLACQTKYVYCESVSLSPNSIALHPWNLVGKSFIPITLDPEAKNLSSLLSNPSGPVSSRLITWYRVSTWRPGTFLCPRCSRRGPCVMQAKASFQLHKAIDAGPSPPKKKIAWPRSKLQRRWCFPPYRPAVRPILTRMSEESETVAASGQQHQLAVVELGGPAVPRHARYTK